MTGVFDFFNLPNYQILDYQKLNLDSYPLIKKLLPQKLRDFFRVEIHKLESDLEIKFNWKTEDG
ncbi:MAG: hypothetical protein F6K25_10795 [Okeania sp. SIO2G4]|uniref:hypothetical protein n=1 Tax=unclassified Okeania TaxID=2634635 RepID=UPI0013BD29EA|nr:MULTISPECIES: hypothetical protein [unclassified Okeania]NEP04404.1 hypothetical protein [Okeania sp. SIO4D6]NEP37979.1 hypothetical protein [Okeania sp. SIO2H7]NEP93525.1 hypothetical protein [Okeania sp. SIO2F5]NEQ91171.1 hypothetical protein [Okeania sp. SIO2G4]